MTTVVRMTEPDAARSEQVDPKEAMRRALEAKKAATHKNADGVGPQKSMGGPHAKAGGKRQFRRKAGG